MVNRWEEKFTEHVIGADDTKAAIRLLDYFGSQAEDVIARTKQNEIERNMSLIRAYLDKQPRGFRFTQRSLNQRLPRSITGDAKLRRAEKIRIAFEALVADGYRITTERTGRQVVHIR